VLAAPAACATASIDLFETCQLDLELSAGAAAPGTTIVAAGGPFTVERDTQVRVGGVPAEVTDVTRVGCDECDLCRVEAMCAPCGPCFGEELDVETRVTCLGDPLEDPPIPPACDACVESMSFVVPTDAPVGQTTLYVVNSNGASALVPFEVLAAATDTGDTGADTSDTSDTDASDTDTDTDTTP
jgi:hypothetical protein